MLGDFHATSKGFKVVSRRVPLEARNCKHRCHHGSQHLRLPENLFQMKCGGPPLVETRTKRSHNQNWIEIENLKEPRTLLIIQPNHHRGFEIFESRQNTSMLSILHGPGLESPGAGLKWKFPLHPSNLCFDVLFEHLLPHDNGTGQKGSSWPLIWLTARLDGKGKGQVSHDTPQMN